MTTLFTAPGEWTGGGYELAIEFRSESVRAAHDALAALWSHPNIRPGYARSDVEPEDQTPMSLCEILATSKAYGRARLGQDVLVATRSVLIPYDQGSVWIYFGFPMSSLRRAYPVGAYPFHDGSTLEWRNEVDDWLRKLAADIFLVAPFSCALISHEPEESVADEVAEGTIPQVRWEGILVPADRGLMWYPPTEGPSYTFDQVPQSPRHRQSSIIQHRPMTTHATGTFDVTMNPQPPYDTAEGATLGRVSITKQFRGDLEASSTAEMLSAMTAVKGSAGYVAIERVTGMLHGRAGSFVLQHTGTMNRGKGELTVSVVPDSGTGALEGIGGTMTIEVVDGKHGYSFEYAIDGER